MHSKIRPHQPPRGIFLHPRRTALAFGINSAQTMMVGATHRLGFCAVPTEI